MYCKQTLDTEYFTIFHLEIKEKCFTLIPHVNMTLHLLLLINIDELLYSVSPMCGYKRSTKFACTTSLPDTTRLNFKTHLIRTTTADSLHVHVHDRHVHVDERYVSLDYKQVWSYYTNYIVPVSLYLYLHCTCTNYIVPVSDIR